MPLASVGGRTLPLSLVRDASCAPIPVVSSRAVDCSAPKVSSTPSVSGAPSRLVLLSRSDTRSAPPRAARSAESVADGSGRALPESPDSRYPSTPMVAAWVHSSFAWKVAEPPRVYCRARCGEESASFAAFGNWRRSTGLAGTSALVASSRAVAVVMSRDPTCRSAPLAISCWASAPGA